MSEQNNYEMLVDPEMKEIVDSFLEETKEIFENLNKDLVELEQNSNDLDLLNQIFRAFHTIKGTSGFLGLEKLQTVTHKCEDILNKLRKGEAKLNSDLMDTILLSFDSIQAIVACIEKEKTENVNVTKTLKELDRVLSVLEGKEAEPEKPKKTSRKKKLETKSEVKNDNELLESDKEELSNDETNQVENSSSSDQSVKKALSQSKTDSTIRVDVERLDELLNIVSELVLGRNQLQQVNNHATLSFEGTQIARDLADATKQIDLMTNELQLVVMKTRMVKIGKVFNRFPRLVRDLARDTQKNIMLEIFGEETELDKTLIEEINDPLVHLVRNSIDHGIESPEERKSLGKDPQGTITLSASQEGNNIVIAIKDDGKGIDPEKLKAKAIAKGLITEEKAKEFTKQEAFNIIFMPGFSTAEKVTNISGRGVGMDVVRTNVRKLRGIIDIESEVNVGTTVKIKLPLTLAIISGMVVKVNGETIVIPLNSVLEVVRMHTEDIKSINGKEVIKVRDQIIPLIDVDEIMYGKTHAKDDRVYQHVVTVGIAEQRFGIKVDELIGQKEIVIKSLGNYLGNINGLAGSTIMGDGTVVMILDIGEILHFISAK
ncbi:MAG: chemotaxis protein CheA [Melioribacteraceae bacterium]|nr:chemotaxis protein CheA [Melioribacteraceae bacterium]